MTNVVLIAAATPLLWEGTELIIIARLGEAKIPIPDPTSTSGSIEEENEMVGPILESIRKPIADKTKPTGMKSLEFDLSNNHPVIGAKSASETDTGIRYIPASRGVRFIDEPCR
jgi:hypothetical protein